MNFNAWWLVRCFPAASAATVTHNAASQLVVQRPDGAHPVHSTARTITRVYQLRRHRALLTRSCPEAARAHYRLLSGLTATPLPSAQRAAAGAKHSSGRERRCNDQSTEAYHSNAHPTGQERRFIHFHLLPPTNIRYSPIEQLNGVNESDMEGRVQLANDW